MSGLNAELERRLEALRQAGLERALRRIDSPQGARVQWGGRTLLNFSSNDYLGLAHHPALREGARSALEQYGAGAGSARLVCGSLAVHHDLDGALAEFKGAPAALAFSSGYAMALGTIPALVGQADVVVLDKRVHASIVDAARLSGAKLRVFGHNDLDELEAILRWADGRRGQARGPQGGPGPGVLVVTESVFSMDGDQAPLVELVELKDRYGAWLMVDEAHATGLYGAQRRGLAEALGVGDRIEVQMGTLGKALGAAGGYVAGSRCLIDYLVNRARSFIFSTAPVPAAAGAALAGIGLVRSIEGAGRCQQLWARVAQVRQALRSRGWPVEDPASAIVPLLVGEEGAAVAAAAVLHECGVFIPAIRYPAVARGAARLRLTVSAAHSEEDVRVLSGALAVLSDRVQGGRVLHASVGSA